MSSAHAEARVYARPANEWTIMVFFAGDPHLSPSMTAQLKSIKDAGFQENTSVLVHYDPNERGVAVTTFDINRKRKEDLLKKNEKATRIGDGKDPFVRNLLEDAISGATKGNTADQALRTFLNIGTQPEYRARHYMIFLVGHGVVVGNDAFLPDSSPQSGITLQQLGDTIRHFKRSLPKDAVIDLIGLHSCSMSAIEVAFELKGAAKYMLATEGVSFVASWPYRQLLKKILNAIDETQTEAAKANTKSGLNVEKLIKSMHGLSLHNSTDFMFSGFSADVCLCSLDEKRIEKLETPMRNLTIALKQLLTPPPGWDPTKEWRGLELIKLAHLEAQSYFQETYTDLYDFCLCLKRRCDGEQAVINACDGVIDALKETARDPVIIQSDHFGPLYQYSHGLSIFFPWSRPTEEEPLALDDNMLTRYERYEFTRALGSNSWLSFLEDYFTVTQRKSREDEDGNPVAAAINANGMSRSAIGSMIARLIGSAVASGSIDALAGKDSPAMAKDSPAMTKDSPAQGGSQFSDGCGCSVKNYPRTFSLSPRVAQDPNPEATYREQRAEVS